MEGGNMYVDNNYNLTTKFSMDYVKKKCKEYSDTFAGTSKYRIGSLKVSSILYSKEIRFFNAPFWVIDFDLAVTKKISCYYKTILISDIDGKIIESHRKWEQIDGETILSKERVLNIVTNCLKKLEDKYKTSYMIHTDKSYYYICKRNSTNGYDAIWCVAFSDISNEFIAENVSYLQISDKTDDISIILDNGRISID